jgi:hypothetical protein
VTTPYLPPASVRRLGVPQIRPLARFAWEGARLSLTAVTGQVGALTRAATGALIDRTGATVTAAHSMPRWEARDWTGTGVRDHVGLRMAADDMAWPLTLTPETGTLLVDFSEAGTRTTSGAGLVYLGNDGQTGARLTLDSNGTNYRATIHNGTTSESVTATGAAPTTGQSARALVQLRDTGSTWEVRLWLDVLSGAGDELTAWSTPIARATTWGSGTALRVNRVGSAGTQGSTWIRRLVWMPGLLNPEQMDARL